METLIKNKSEKVFDILNLLFLSVTSFICLYPFYNILISSFDDPNDAARGGITLWPRDFSIESYKVVFRDSNMINAFIVTISRTLIGTLIAVLFTAAFAYGVSKRDLLGRNLIMGIALVTMYFSGGLIPTYIMIAKWFHLKENFLVYILPNMFSAFNAIIMMTFFNGIPKEIEESAQIDGANHLTIFVKLILPLSMPVLATIALFNGVFHWNSWFDGLLYGGSKLKTLQQILMQLINSNNNVSILAGNLGMRAVTSESVKLSTMVITTLPIVFAYPFLQRYFVKGIMIGSVKG